MTATVDSYFGHLGLASSPFQQYNFPAECTCSVAHERITSMRSGYNFNLSGVRGRLVRRNADESDDESVSSVDTIDEYELIRPHTSRPRGVLSRHSVNASICSSSSLGTSECVEVCEVYPSRPSSRNERVLPGDQLASRAYSRSPPSQYPPPTPMVYPTGLSPSAHHDTYPPQVRSPTFASAREQPAPNVLQPYSSSQENIEEPQYRIMHKKVPTPVSGTIRVDGKVINAGSSSRRVKPEKPTQRSEFFGSVDTPSSFHDDSQAPEDEDLRIVPHEHQRHTLQRRHSDYEQYGGSGEEQTGWGEYAYHPYHRHHQHSPKASHYHRHRTVSPVYTRDKDIAPECHERYYPENFDPKHWKSRAVTDGEEPTYEHEICISRGAQDLSVSEAGGIPRRRRLLREQSQCHQCWGQGCQRSLKMEEELAWRDMLEREDNYRRGAWEEGPQRGRC